MHQNRLRLLWYEGVVRNNALQSCSVTEGQRSVTRIASERIDAKQGSTEMDLQEIKASFAKTLTVPRPLESRLFLVQCLFHVSLKAQLSSAVTVASKSSVLTQITT